MKSIFQILFLFLLLISNPTIAQTSKDLVNVTNDFLSTLNEEELRSVKLEFQDTSRTRWTNLPVGMAERPGIRYGDLSEKSRIAFHNILILVFSSQGYLKMHTIMDIDDYLLEMYEILRREHQLESEIMQELEALDWGYDNYYVSIWGNLGEIWGLKFEGHHISLNITVAGDEVSYTPFFIGTDPARFRVARYAGLRPLSKEEDYGLELINLLSADQKNKAVISDKVPGDILTAADSEQRLTEFLGIKGSELNDVQRVHLKYIIREYLGNFERETAHYYMDLLDEKSVDEIYFGWIGGTERVTNHYYVIHGPDFLIEYDNVGWIYKGDHIHTIFRDKRNDFGEDLLKQHYKEHKH